jgi:predicted AAA+ superfamily ATPase
VSDFFRAGGEMVVIDEIHKRAGWTQELKSLYDSFPTTRLLFSGSSPLHLQLGKVDLSRRAVYYNLPTLSFREYLALAHGRDHERLGWDSLIGDHATAAREILAQGPVLGHFRDFLEHGAYPFFLEGKETYHQRLHNVIDKVLYEDITTITGMRHEGVPVLKKILWQVAGAQPFQLNVERLASNLGISKPTLYNYLSHLERADLLLSIMPHASGSARARKPEKLFLNNTNLIRAVGRQVDIEDPLGNIRETYFASQVRNAGLVVTAAKRGDFVVASKYLFEIGGRAKSSAQLAGEPNAFVVRDDIEVGARGVLPLWLFGFLY